MQVFELYIRRLLKRKKLIAVLLLLPLVASFLLIYALKPSYGPEYAVILNSVIGLLIINTITNTMLFYGDRQHATGKRILLSTHSKFSFYCQIVAVFLVISVVQLAEVILFSEFVLGVHLLLSFVDYFIILIAYTLLNTIAVGLGLMVTCSTLSKYSSWALVIIIGFVLAVMGGLLLPNDQLPIIVRDIVTILPTYWLTKVVIILFSDIGDHMHSIASYLLALTVCAVVIMLLLIRTKSERI